MSTKIVTRVINVISGRADEAVQKIERPEDQTRLFVRQLDEELIKLRNAVALAISVQKRLETQIQNEKQKAQDWERKATFALQTGNEDLARESLLRKEHCEELATTLKQGFEKQNETVEKLKRSLNATQLRAEKAKREYSVLVARYKSAKAKLTLNSMLADVEGSGSSAQSMESLRNKIMQVEAQAEADEEAFSNLPGVEDDLEAQLSEAERRMKGDEALAKLKAKMIK